MKRAVTVVLILTVGGILGVAEANAGVLATDSAALAGWQGTRLFDVSLPLPLTVALKANVDYAVYAPGSFGSSTDLGNPADPSGGSDYVYAYQVLNDQGGNRPVEQLSVGFLDLAPEGTGIANVELPASIGYVDGFASPDIDPTASFSPDNTLASVKTAAGWAFPSGLQAGSSDVSDVLIFTSPFGPEWDRASLIGGGLSEKQALPSPIPEPTSVAWLIFFSVASVYLFRSSRRS